jgi:hypothetical protein
VVPVAFQGGHLASPDPFNGDFSIRGLQWRPSGTSRLLQVVQLGRLVPGHRDDCFVMARRERHGPDVTGRATTIDGMAMLRFRDGRVVEEWQCEGP